MKTRNLTGIAIITTLALALGGCCSLCCGGEDEPADKKKPFENLFKGFGANANADNGSNAAAVKQGGLISLGKKEVTIEQEVDQRVTNVSNTTCKCGVKPETPAKPCKCKKEAPKPAPKPKPEKPAEPAEKVEQKPAPKPAEVPNLAGCRSCEVDENWKPNLQGKHYAHNCDGNQLNTIPITDGYRRYNTVRFHQVAVRHTVVHNGAGVPASPRRVKVRQCEHGSGCTKCRR